MKDKAALRQEFRNIAQNDEQDKQYQSRTAQLESLRSSMVESIKILVEFLDKKTNKVEVINQLKEIGTPDALKVVSAVQKLEETINGKQTDLKPVVDALNALKRETTLIPSKIRIEKTEQVKVSNLDEVKLDTKDLEKAINALKLDVKVDAPIINTEKTDIEPLKQVMLDLLKAVNGQKLEVPKEFKVSNIKHTDLSKVEKKLDQSNKHLKELVDKPTGGGGGGGNGSPYTDSQGVTKNVVLASGRVPISGTVTVANPTTNPETGLAKEATLAMLNHLYYGKKTSGDYTYYGFKVQGVSAYRIMKKHNTLGSDVTWASGTNFVTDWANYTNLTYGVI